MSAELVIARLEMFEHFGFKWIAAGTGGFHHWITGNQELPRPEFMTCGLCCFHLPLAAAIETMCMTRDRAGDLIVDQMLSGMNGGNPTKWVPGLLTQFSTGGLISRANYPNRGDVVFFSGGPVKYFAHVAVATGNADQVMSFGHDAPYLQGGTHTRLVERMSIGDVKRINPALTNVHFGAPSW